MATAPPLRVFYDGGCPLCRREIGHYRRLRPLQPLQFVDIGSGALPAGAPPIAELLARLHAQQADGQWLQGAPAFVAIWARLPGWHWAARLARLPGVMVLLDRAYEAFLRLRPWWRRPAACTLKP